MGEVKEGRQDLRGICEERKEKDQQTAGRADRVLMGKKRQGASCAGGRAGDYDLIFVLEGGGAMRTGGKWMIRTTISGNVIEKSKFWVGAAARPRGKRTASTTRRKQDQNDRDAVKRLARSINCNFGYKDLLVTLEYDEAGFTAIGGDHGAADRAMMTFLGKARRAMQRDGKVLRFTGAVTSEKDGETGDPARIHHHMVLPAEAAPYLELWRYGAYYVRTLRRQPDYTQIAVYLMAQTERQGKDAKKWHSSRNLKKPVVYEREARHKSPLRQPAGALLLESGVYDESCGNHYIRYVLAPKPGEDESPAAADARRQAARERAALKPRGSRRGLKGGGGK